jgi:Domain of unknown function (DUF4082)/Fibronectin type III domain/Bacterial Ig domain
MAFSLRIAVAAIVRFALPRRLSALVGSSRGTRLTARSGLILIALTGLFAVIPAAASAACGNPVQCENQLPGDPPSDWQVDGVGDSTIQGYATSMGVNAGATESFKINTPSTSYHIDILRLGYYGGDGARLIATNIKPTATLPQTQPACMDQANTGLIDCGNWGVSAQWAVPSTAVSGLYVAHLVRDDSQDKGGDSQIFFIVRNDAGHSNILYQTSDETWEAYNDYGGNSLYSCTIDCPAGNPEAYKGAAAVSYNRPFDGTLATDTGFSDPFYAEYQLIYWMEENGYDVSYTDEANVDSNGALLKNHKIFISSAHDEYWSPGQRANVAAAAAAGVSLAFFSGNEMFWKTRWGPSTDGSNTPYRTLTSYKETHYNAQVDPQDPPTWTGAWADPRFSPPGDGGAPSNALTGQQFLVNSGTADLKVPSTYSKLRFWRNTSVAKLASGTTATLAPDQGMLGYEWDADEDNGFRPSGEFDMSSTTVSGVQAFTDYGSELNTSATATHHLTLYRTSSGALVFGAGTVQWSWGLSNVNPWASAGPDPKDPPDPNVQQATVNLFADMGAQPTTLQSGLVATSQSTDTTAPGSTITSPTGGATVQDNSAATISGTATDTGGGVVAEVDVSTDGGSTWHAATINGADAASVTWSYTWTGRSAPTTTIKSRAVDDSGNVETPSAGVTVNVTCPCSIWGAGETPGTLDSGDTSSVTVGTAFTSDSSGSVTGIRFYKSTANTGTHVGGLYSSNGTLLASATFGTESASGWQQVSFSTPVAISANTTYVAAYLAPKGHYAADTDYFETPPPTGGNVLNSPPLHAVPASMTVNNGFYTYNAALAFPTSTFEDTNYWVDPVFMPSSGVPGAPTAVSATAGNASATVTWSAPVTGGTPTSYKITPFVGTTAQPSTTITGTPPATTTTITGLTNGTTYTFTVTASNSSGTGPASAASNAATPSNSAPGAPTAVAASPASGQALVSWTAPAANGSTIISYTVTPFVGANAQAPVQVTAPATSANVTGLANGTAYTFTVTATNSNGTGPASSASAPATPEATVFDFSTPSTLDSGDTSGVELGVNFTASTSGSVTGIRFYKAAANTGSHVGSLWSSTGTLLASGTFTNETASGWQTLVFSSPVSIVAGTDYVAAYLAPNGHYSYTGAAFASGGVTNGPLTAVANGSVSPGNGLYAYSSTSTFPSSSFNSSNYWVDVLVQPGGGGTTGPPTAPTGVNAAPASSQALVSWSAPSSNGGSAVTSYTVTPFAGSTAGTPVKVSGSSTNTTITGLTNGTPYTFTVTATNANGTSPASSASAPATPEDAIFDFSTPSTIDSGDTAGVELGVNFTASTSGSVTGIRFYKATANTGTHVGSLWTSTGTLLGSGTFTNETGSGWQTLTFASPVSIIGGTHYVAAYLAPNGHYSYTSAAFTSGGVTNGPLTAAANGSVSSGNGVYAYSGTSTFPSSSFNASNYWVDVLFQPGTTSAPGQPTGVTAAPASSQALVSWTPPANQGSSVITGYTVAAQGAGAPAPVTVGGSVTSANVPGLQNGTAYTFTVTAINSSGSGQPSSASPPVTADDTIFDFSTPTNVDSGDTSAIEVGVKFNATSNGNLTGIRFYKASANTGSHVGSLWDASGNLLASGTFTNETPSGWQTLVFSSPVAITSGTTYVAGYLAPNGHYSYTANGFASGVNNGPLQADANSTSANGVYTYGGTSAFPTSTYNATDYWVDVLFQPGS